MKFNECQMLEVQSHDVRREIENSLTLSEIIEELKLVTSGFRIIKITGIFDLFNSNNNHNMFVTLKCPLNDMSAN